MKELQVEGIGSTQCGLCYHGFCVFKAVTWNSRFPDSVLVRREGVRGLWGVHVMMHYDEMSQNGCGDTITRTVSNQVSNQCRTVSFHLLTVQKNLCH
jgi:hypothetical protein